VLLPWQESVWQQVTGDRSRMHHALLLHGPQGNGKKTFGLHLAQWLLCQTPQKAGACGHCAACHWFEQGTHPDFRLIEPGQEGDEAPQSGKRSGKFITIKDIRLLGDFFNLASHQGGWRVVLIHPAESLNLAAANALLKTLEEPPPLVMILLVTHQLRRMLPTVLSRCNKVALPMPDREQGRRWLQSMHVSECERVLAEAGGAPLLALEFANADRQERRRHFIGGLQRPASHTLFDLAGGFHTRLDEAWGWLVKWLHDLIRVKSQAPALFFPGEVAALQHLAGQMSLEKLLQLHAEVQSAGRILKHPLNGQLLLESWLSRYANLQEAKHG